MLPIAVIRPQNRQVQKQTASELQALVKNAVRKVHLVEMGEGGLGLPRFGGNGSYVFRPFFPLQHLLLALLKGNWARGFRVLSLRSDHVGF